ncbi:hypothetical protein A4G99_03725 [Haladaptatus sp. R4]|uniref:hypothetical protein n=1 Tax=Haladaptatus sp. R4 TaxID=1679489 RepID=UPI0007B46856|nr:hypothetical protein [Haladaptatus sp. R4]KZN25589.1 hypothetical protein A4G99_03725 [Haladaptatus sp. R4]
MGKSHILMRKVNQVKPDNYEEILQINAPNGGLSGEVQTIAITHVLKKDAEMLIQVDGGGVEGGLLCSSLREYDSSDLSLGISFEEELVITGKNIAKSPGSFTQFWVIYSVDKGTLLPKRSETTKRHGVEYEKKWFKTKDGVEYSVEVPRALETVSRTIADEDTVFKERDEGRITGRVKAYLRRQVTEDGGHDLPWYYNTPSQQMSTSLMIKNKTGN